MPVYLEKDELKDAYHEAVKTSNEWFKPFDEYERLAENKLSKTLGKNMPRVNDGSLAASLIETPMQVFPSLMPGKFTSQSLKKAWIDELANIIWKTKIMPNANTQATFFDKEQIALYRALRYGAQPRYNFFVSNDTYTGSDWSLPYIKNVKLEPGKFSVEDCDYIFMDVYYTKLQLKKLIDQIETDNREAKKEGRKADSTWHIKRLKELSDMALTTKQMEEQNINEREKQVHASGIKVTVCFNRGIGSPFYMFSSQLSGDDNCLREWDNPDPTGDLPITMQYCYENLESPYGVGRIQLAGPTQNVLDFMTQAHVLATQVGIESPVKISGPVDQTNLNSIVFAPRARWITGNASVDVVKTESQVYSQFPTSFGMYKGQLQTLQGRTDGSVSSESGDTNFSKTQAGVKMQEARTNSQDNYLRNKADTASAKMAQKMMNVHMAQMDGAEILDIAEDDRERLEKAGYFDENPETNEPSLNEIPFLWEDVRDTFKFEYDPRPESDDEEKSRNLEVLDIISSNPNIIPAIEADGYKLNIGELMKNVIAASGITSDKILTKMSEDEMNQPLIDPGTGEPIEEPQPGMDEEMTPEATEDLPTGEEMPIEPEIAPEYPAEAEIPPELLDTMDMYEVDEPTAMAILEARAQGFDEGEIVEFLRSNGVTA